MRLTTPKAYVQEYGTTETGRLLANKGIITPASDDDSDYTASIYEGGDSTSDVKDDVAAELNRYIDNAQDEIIPRIRRYLNWPLTRDGFAITVSDVPSELARITREVARYYLHDEDVRNIEEVSMIERRYRNALELADKIGAGTYRLSGVDTNFEDDEVIYSL